MQTALAGEIQDQIRPLSDALEISTMANIRQLRTAISALNFKKGQCTVSTAGVPCWTLNDQKDLDDAVVDLQTAETVLKALRDGKR